MSKILNRIAPQDEVLLETDIGKMIPSAKQLAEERVTRFNADKEIRLRVKALEESGSAIEEAKAAAEQASKAAQQAEQAKTAIGDVGGRLEAVETSVGTLTETVEANNNVAKFTAYPNFVKMVCDALTATKKYGTISHPATSYPVNLVYTMANGWTIVAMEVPNNTSYLCVFDADWALLWSAKRSGDVRSYYQYVCEEVDGVAYVFGARNHGTKTVTTITEGADGSAIVTNETEVVYADGVTSSVNWNVTYAQAIGRYIVFADVVFDTQAMMVVANLAGSIGMAWKGAVVINGTRVFYANVSHYIYRFELDGDENIQISQTSTVQQKGALPLNRYIWSYYYSATLNIQYDGRFSFFNCGASFNNDTTYGTRETPSKASYPPMAFAVAAFKGIITRIDRNGDIVAWDSIYNANAHESFQVRERVLCPISAYQPYKIVYEGNGNATKSVMSKIHGMDSNGIWMSFTQNLSWTQFNVLQGKLIRVLWEDLK